MLPLININDIIAIAQKAGDAIMEIYAKDFSVEYKEDQSPLTQADKNANAIIVKGLESLNLKFPILSEEGKEIPYEERKNWEYFWMVDPLDGTKEFIKKNDEFTVNIALIYQNTPVLGVVYAPALNEMYWAKRGYGAFKNNQPLPLCTNQTPDKTLTVAASKSHLSEETKNFIENLKSSTENLIFVSKGSSLKLCMVAEGSADVYPRLAPTTEWDTAAADAIVREVGKMTYQYPLTSNIPMQYNKENLLNPWFVVQ